MRDRCSHETYTNKAFTQDELRERYQSRRDAEEQSAAHQVDSRAISVADPRRQRALATAAVMESNICTRCAVSLMAANASKKASKVPD
jgi:hypothetical protein